MTRIFNFSAGPAVLPEEVLSRAGDEMLDWHGTGMCVMEMSHRGKEFMSIAAEAEKDLRELLAIPQHYKVLFLQGGATLQFAQIPMNLLAGRGKADYVVTGEWSKKAVKEAQAYCDVHVAASSEDRGFTYFPSQEDLQIRKDAAYLHYCSNETIGGVEAHWIPQSPIPLVADASSHILSRPLDVSKFGLIYAGAQKNIGPAGLTIVIVREDLVGHAQKGTPSVMDYKLQAAADSMLNTPATYAMYIAGLVFKWLKTQGGLAEIEKRNVEKAQLLYDYLDKSSFYKNPVNPKDRSRMNVPFTLADAKLDEAFLKGAEREGMVQLKGHRSVGGMRASIYNAMPIEGVRQLVAYMKDFGRAVARAGKKFEVLALNPIAQVGLKRLPAERYEVVKESKSPDVILVRSADMHAMKFDANLKAVGRAGAGVNNIPVAELSKRGVPVFNAPGANANAVKELVVAGMLIAARNLAPALDFVRGLDAKDLEKKVEAGKKAYAGVELPGHTLGVVGLGKIGSLVADAAIRLGMNVLGYDPEITVDAAWSLPAQVRKANSVDELLRASDFVTLHVPLVDKTRGLVNAKNIKHMKAGAVLLNFSRDGVVEDAAALQALSEKKLSCYVTDFPSAELIGKPGVVALPHLGASTSEAEDNCAVMVADQVREYLAHGTMENAVNFPNAQMPRESPYRLAIANANVPNMLANISQAMGSRKINIHNMLNKSKKDMAYTLVDVDSPVPRAAIEELCSIRGVLAVRYIPVES